MTARSSPHYVAVVRAQVRRRAGTHQQTRAQLHALRAEVRHLNEMMGYHVERQAEARVDLRRSIMRLEERKLRWW